MDWASIILVALLAAEPTTAPAADGASASAASQPTTQPAAVPEGAVASGPVEGSGAEAAPAAAEPGPPASPLEIEDAAVVARNMFLPRTPDGADTGPIPPPPPPVMDEVWLTGLMCDGDEFVALFEDRKDRRSIFVGVGETVGLWRIERIEMDQLTAVGSDGTSLTVKLGESLKASLAARETGPRTDAAPPPTGAIASGSRPPTDTRSIEQRMRERRERERGRF